MLTCEKLIIFVHQFVRGTGSSVQQETLDNHYSWTKCDLVYI